MNEAQVIEAIMLLPSARRFADAMALDCLQGRNLLVLTGAQLAPECLRRLLDDALGRRRGSRVQAVGLEVFSSAERPSAFLARHAVSNEDAFRPGPTQLDAAGLPDTVFLLSGLERLPPTAQETWAKYFHAWTQYPATSAHVLALATSVRPGRLRDATGDTRMAVHAWWRSLSALEVHLLCKLCTDASEEWAAARWREAVLPHVAGCDTRLVAGLWDAVLQSEEELAAALRQHGESLGLSRVPLTALWQGLRRASGGNADVSRLEGSWGQAWSLGAAHGSEEHGVEFTAAALAVLDERSDLRHRMWRGQAALLLPHLDHLRISVCRELISARGRDWPIRLGGRLFAGEERTRVEADPLATEFGPLEIILRESRHSADRRFHPLVKRARQMRNALAHYQPVSLSDYRELLAEQRAVNLGPVHHYFGGGS